MRPDGGPDYNHRGGPDEGAAYEAGRLDGYDAGFEDGKGECLPLLQRIITEVILGDDEDPTEGTVYCRACDEYDPHPSYCFMPAIVEHVMSIYQWFEVGPAPIEDAIPELRTLEPFPPPGPGLPTPDNIWRANKIERLTNYEDQP